MKCINNILKCVFIIVSIMIFAGIIWSLWFVANFHGDTYGKSEAYVINLNTKEDSRIVTSSDIVDFLFTFQNSHPQYQLININSKGEKYHYFSDKIENRREQYMVFFYFEDIDMTFSCITEVTSRNNSLIKLYAVNKSTIFRHWERVNNYKEISRKTNKKIKKKFETEILDNLGVKWRYKRFWD